MGSDKVVPVVSVLLIAALAAAWLPNGLVVAAIILGGYWGIMKARAERK